MNGINQPQTGMQLFDAEGRRLYVTEDERRAFIAAAAKAPREVRTFCGVLHATGCRISEALAFTPQQIDLSGRVVVFESLKKRSAVSSGPCQCRPSCWIRLIWCTPSVRRSGMGR